MATHANNITNSLLSPTTATAAAVLLASKSTSQKNTTTINNNNSSRIYNRASAAAHLDEYDICARSTYTFEDNQSEQQQPSLGPQSLAESIPLEDILNTQDNNKNINGSQQQPHYANQSVQLETIIRSLTAPGEKNSTNNVPPPSANAASPIISPAAAILPVSLARRFDAMV